MRNSLKALFLLVVSLCARHAFGQSEEDALNLSSFGLGGTARSNGLANAFGALGADPVSVTINPAGMGLYNTSSLGMTTVLEINQGEALHYGNANPSSQERFALNNLSLVLHTPGKAGSKWRGSAWGMTYDRLQSRHWTTDALGESVPSTILTAFANEAEGTPYTSIMDVFPWTAGPAWDAYGIDTLANPDPLDTLPNSSYVGFIPIGADTRQRHIVESHGASRRTAFFYSGNYMDRVYVGGSIGVVGQRLQRITTHTEYALDPALDMQGLTYKEELNTTGNGFDVNLGVLVRIGDRVRGGASFQSPQWLLLNDAWFTEFSTTFRTPDTEGQYSYASSSPDGAFSYRLRTPWRTTLSAAYFAGKNGLVSVDYDYVDMRSMRYNQANDFEDIYDFAFENDAIRDRYRAQHGLRIGTEWRAGNWYFRGGWSYRSDAHVDGDLNQGQPLRTYAAGFGYRGDHLSFDLAFNASAQRTKFYQYDPALVDATTVERAAYSTFITVGLRP
jgi:hypothetical protein